METIMPECFTTSERTGARDLHEAATVVMASNSSPRRGAVESGWMQGPVLDAFEARVGAVEREKQAAVTLEAKIAALERDEQAAAARRDYDSANQCKQEIDTLTGALDVLKASMPGPPGASQGKDEINGHSPRFAADWQMASPFNHPLKGTLLEGGKVEDRNNSRTSNSKVKVPNSGHVAQPGAGYFAQPSAGHGAQPSAGFVAQPSAGHAAQSQK